MATLSIERRDGRRVPATYVRHLRTLAGGRTNIDIELYRLADGTEIECSSPSNDGRRTPVECDPEADYYPGEGPAR